MERRERQTLTLNYLIQRYIYSQPVARGPLKVALDLLKN